MCSKSSAAFPGYGVGMSAAAISTEELTKFYVGVAGLRRRDLSR